MSFHLIYGKLHSKFEQVWYHKNRLQVHWKMIRQYDAYELYKPP
jgi:hypothetical protein